MRALVVAIDGPAGAGKSTVAKRVAAELALKFLDTGAMYRALALKAHRHGLTADHGDEAAKLGENTQITFAEGSPQRVLLDGEDVTDLIRTPEMSEMASALSVHAPVRRLLAKLQREIVESGGVTLEGRDTTTVTAFDAQVRIFLTASLDERTRRRMADLEASGAAPTYADLRAQIEERDTRDSTRADSPLMIAEGVSVIDSEGMTIDDVVMNIRKLCEDVMSGGV